MMVTFIEHEPYTFNKFVSSHKFLKIPDFQRSYSWKIKQINDFFASIVDADSQCFIGIVVCAKGDTKRLEIVDGQQRITTISLSLIALKHLVTQFENSEEKQRLLRNIEEQLAQYDPDEDAHISVIEPNREELKAIYNHLLQSGVTNLPTALDKLQQIYVNNYLAIAKLMELAIHGNLTKAETLYKKIINAQFIALVLSKEDDLQEIYDGLNSTGLGLSVADQVKNKLLQRAKALGVKAEIDELWEDLETLFAKLDPVLFPKFLRHYWIAKWSYISQKDLYARIRKHINELSAAELTQWLEDVYFNAQLYCLIYSKRSEDFVSADVLKKIPAKIKEQLLAFRAINNIQVYPALLSIADRAIAEKSYKEAYANATLNALWSFCLRSTLVSVSPADYEKLLSNVAQLVRTSDVADVQNQVGQEIKKLRDLVDEDKQFIRNFSESLFYNSDKDLIVEILDRIMLHYDPTIKLTERNIEHVLPQKPAKWGLKGKDVRDYVHNIGNLTLLHPSDNNLASNEPFETKCKQVYSPSKLELNKKIVEYTEFSVDPKKAINKRAMDLAKLALDIFKVSLAR